VTALVLTPTTPGHAIELGNRLWRKKVLPVGEIAYKGRTLRFTPEYLGRLADAFRARAYDVVPFQLATGANEHTNDPERTRGQVLDMDAQPDGLWITAKLTEAGERVLQDNPELGVSARIVEDYDRADGRFFPAAVQHVLGTLDPRVPGLGGWQAIETANVPAGSQVIDLSSSDWIGLQPAAEPWEVALVDQAAAEADGELARLTARLSAKYGTEPDASVLMDTIMSVRDADELACAAERHAIELGWDPGTAIELSRQEERETARGLGDAYAASGDISDAIECYEMAGIDSGSAIELANSAGGYSGMSQALDNSMALELARATRQEAQAAEAARPPSRNAYDRVQDAYRRVGQGTYVMDFATPGSQAGRDLAAARWASQRGMGGTTGSPTCGPSDPYGYCIERYHAPGCGSSADPAIMSDELRGLMSARTSSPLIDSNGRTGWQTSEGRPAGLSDYIETMTGVPSRQPGLFESQRRRQPVSIERQQYLGDPDTGTGTPMPRTTQDAARDIASQLGLSQPTASGTRQQARDRQAVLAERFRGRTPVSRDQQWDTGSRQARVRAEHPAPRLRLEPSETGLPGTLPQVVQDGWR
jgi:tetratricopeptide (TPR) repeat protein